MTQIRIPSGFVAVISRIKTSVVYPCDKCGLNRGELMNPQMTRVHILECINCEPQAHAAQVKFIESGYTWRPSE